MPVLDVVGIDSCYGRSLIIHDLSLSVDRNECVALFGRKGAGKSTLLKTLAGIVRPTHGEIRLNGTVISGMESTKIAQAGLVYVPEDRRIFREMTVAENIEVGKRPPADAPPSWALADVFDLFPELGETRNERADRLPNCIHEFLMIGRALLGQPRVLLLDEPTQDLTESGIERLATALRQLKATGLAIVLSENNVPFAWQVADRAYVIERGTILRSGTMADLAADDEIRRDFLPA